jgi:hypothetical protein
MGLLYVLFQRAHRSAIDARRRASTAGYLAWSLAASLSLVLALSMMLVLAAQLWVLGLWVVSLLLLGICIVPALGPWLLRHALVPAGQVKLAYHCGRFSTAAGTDPEAFGLVAAAWAVAGARKPVSGEAIAWVQAQREARGTMGDAEVVATAFLLARGDADTARQLLGSVRELAERHPAVRELAGEWLAVDAAERGAWREILPEAGADPATPLRFFLEGIAAARLGAAGAPGRSALWARWVMAPYRRQTLELLRAVAPAVQAAGDSGKVAGGGGEDAGAGGGSEADVRSATDAADAEVSRSSPSPSLDEAIALHVRAFGAELDPDGLQQLAASWDRALEAAETMAWLERRADQLGATPGAAQRAAGEIMETVARELRATIERRRLPSPSLRSSRFGQLLGAKLRHGRLDELELQFTRWADRVQRGPALPPVDEWREFLAVRQAYRDVSASGGDELRRLAFPHIFSAANRAAVALWNERHEHSIAHSILAWELEEARAVGDAAALELAAKNAALKFTTRTGPYNE